MGHVNAGLEFLVTAFNDMWPLVLATFLGVWIAFKQHHHQEISKSKDVRFQALEHSAFVLSSQLERMQTLYREHFGPKEKSSRRAFTVEPVIIHEGFPCLDMKALPMAFAHKDFTLMNKTSVAEQNFVEIVKMLKMRATRMTSIETLDASSSTGRRRGATLESAVKTLTDNIYNAFKEAIKQNKEVLTELKAYIDSQKAQSVTHLTDFTSWYFLAASCAVAGVFFFSHWAINARSLVSSGLDITLISAVVFAISLYASLAIGILVAVLGTYSLTKRMHSFSIYFWTFLISLQPTVYLLWLDVS
ncbi:MAG: hypothetical protein OEZ43_14955 [Gammaproteobacteria bacterium]|nr:hypothetical protein [Gammaproteobacteria bacterium]